MRLKRLIVGIVAGFVALLLPAAFLPSSVAAPASADRSAATYESRTTAGDRVDTKAKRRSVTIRFVGGTGSFGLVGKVGPKAKSKRVKTVLQRSNTKNGNYKKFRSEKTNGKARYGYTKLRSTGWYRVIVPQSKGLKTGVSKKIRVTKG